MVSFNNLYLGSDLTWPASTRHLISVLLRPVSDSILRVIEMILRIKLRGAAIDRSQDSPKPNPGPEFHLFLKLPLELRERIYAYVLASDQTINPHLCDKTLKFHDDHQPEHNAIDQLLRVTKVSKQLRSESLPIFYSANTFYVDKDTTTYFDRLSHLGRFHMLRNVQLDISMRPEHSAAQTLRCMTQYIKQAQQYESQLLASHTKSRSASRTLRSFYHPSASASASASPSASPSASSLVGATRANLTSHPQYRHGGLTDLNTLIALQKLTSIFPDTGTGTGTHESYTQHLVLPVPHADIFTHYPSLSWFPTTLHGLGIHIYCVPGTPLDHLEQGFIRVTWRQKFQKKDADGGNVERLAADEVLSRALETWPALEEMKRCRVRAFMRLNCKGEKGVWFDVPTEGGGVF
jgi:hypothetical protein